MIILLLVTLNDSVIYAGDSTSVIYKIFQFPNSLISKTNKKIEGLQSAIEKQTARYVRQLKKQEKKLRRKILQKDSNAAQTLFSYDPLVQFNKVKDKILKDSVQLFPRFSGQYLPYADSLQGLLTFFGDKEFSKTAGTIDPAKLGTALKGIQDIQVKMQLADELKQLMQQRKEQIKQYLLKFTGLPRSLQNAYNSYNKQVYYYTQQLQAYKNVFNEPDKMVAQGLRLLRKVPAFNEFMKRNSILAGMFGSGNNTVTTQDLIGLQARNTVNLNIQGLTGTGFNPDQFIMSQVKNAEAQINPFPSMLSKLKGASGDLDMPNYTPNQQHTKKFMQRLEYGTNFQTQHSTSYFPITTDLGFSLGYKLNDKSVVGIGAAYKIGWGKDIQHIVLSSEGAGFRSYADIKLKGSFYASGGFEYNYQQPFSSLQQIKNIDEWAQSGLIGVSKIISLKSSKLKKSKIQFLWDFLSYKQVPQTQAFKFRIGYNFK